MKISQFQWNLFIRIVQLIRVLFLFRGILCRRFFFVFLLLPVRLLCLPSRARTVRFFSFGVDFLFPFHPPVLKPGFNLRLVQTQNVRQFRSIC